MLKHIPTDIVSYVDSHYNLGQITAGLGLDERMPVQREWVGKIVCK